MSTTTENKEEIKIFKPVLVSEDKLELDKDTINYNKNLFDGTDNGFIPMDVDKQVAIQRMSRDLYQYASSGLRELYANEARACRYAKKHHNADPVIVITINQKKRKLVLEGIDSMGMTTERFKKVFTVLGHSDNFDGTEVGQFGMGRAAYTCLSDTIILETFARESNEKYAVLGRNGLGYQIINEPKIESYGTRITLTLYEQLNYENLYNMIEGVCRFSQIKTVLILESELAISSYSTKPAGQYVMGPISIQQRLQSMMSKDNSDNTDINIPINLEDDLIRLDGYISMYSSYGDSYEIRGGSYYSNEETYLVNVPIDANVDLPLCYGILTIKDERRLPPTPDRERLAEKTLEKVNDAVTHLMKTKSELNLKNLQEFYKNKYRKLYEILAVYSYSRGTIEQRIFKILDDTTQHLVELLHLKVWSIDKKKEYLSVLLKSPSEIFHMEKMDKSKIAALEKHSPGCLVFRPQELDHDTMELFEQFGIVSGEKYLQENNIDVHRITEKISECVEHYSEEGFKGYASIPVLASNRIPFSEVSAKTIRVDSEFQTIRKVFKNVICSYRVVKSRKDITDGISFDDFITQIESKKYSTNKGHLTISDIAKKKNITLFEYPDGNLAGRLDSWISELLVVCDADSLFEMSVWLSWKNIKHKFVTDVVSYSKEYDLSELVNRFGLTRNVSVERDNYVKDWNTHIDDVPKLLTLLDGILTISDDRVLEMFLSATKKNQSSDYGDMQNNLDVMQKHLKMSRDISCELSS